MAAIDRLKTDTSSNNYLNAHNIILIQILAEVDRICQILRSTLDPT